MEPLVGLQWQTASCKRDCSQADSTSLASLSNTFGPGLAAPPPPNRSEHPHRKDPVSTAPSDRNSFGELYRNSHIPFFSLTLKLDHPCTGISKYPLNSGLWTIPGELILFQQSPPIFHLAIMQDFLPKIKQIFPLVYDILMMLSGVILPTQLRDDPIVKEA